MDHIHDTSLTDLSSIDKVYALPDFVKQARVLNREDADRLPSTSFAHPQMRLFPIHTPEDTWLSATYFQKNAGAFDEVERSRIAKVLTSAISLWGIGESFTTIPVMEKAAAAIGKIVFRVNDEERATVPYTGIEDFTKIAAEVARHRERYPYETRVDVARQILGDELSSSLPEDIRQPLEKTAGIQMAETREVCRQLRLRSAWYDHFKVDPERRVDAMLKEASDASVGKYVSPVFLQKSAAIIDHLDRLAELQNRYHTDVEAPEDMWHGVTTSMATMFKAAKVRLPDGTWMDRDVIENNKEAISRFLADVCNEKTAGDLGEAIGRLSVHETELLKQVIK